MRILPVSKLDQILRSSRSRGRGRTGCNDAAGILKRFFSTLYRKGLPDGHERASSVASDIRAGVSLIGAWKVFTVPRWRFMGTIAGAPRFSGATSPVRIVRQEGYVSLFQVWKAWRLKELDSHFQGMREFSYRKFHDGIYWRPAIFVSLADKKGQVYSSTTFSAHCYSVWIVLVASLKPSPAACRSDITVAYFNSAVF